MRKWIGILMLAVFIVSFGVGYLITVPEAQAACPCATSCGQIRCLDWGVCQCTYVGFPCKWCCKCVNNDT